MSLPIEKQESPSKHCVLTDISENGWKNSQWNEHVKLDAFSAAMDIFASNETADIPLKNLLKSTFAKLAEKVEEAAFHGKNHKIIKKSQIKPFSDFRMVRLVLSSEGASG